MTAPVACFTERRFCRKASSSCPTLKNWLTEQDAATPCQRPVPIELRPFEMIFLKGSNGFVYRRPREAVVAPTNGRATLPSIHIPAMGVVPSHEITGTIRSYAAELRRVR